MIVLNWLKQLWEAWKKLGKFIGDIVGRIALTLLYFTLVLPFGLGTRFFSDPLNMKLTEAASYWHQRPETKDSLEEARGQ